VVAAETPGDGLNIAHRDAERRWGSNAVADQTVAIFRVGFLAQIVERYFEHANSTI
jgi:hypothetical protein